MAKLKVGVLVGSNRRESLNQKFANALVRLMGDRIEAHFVRIDDLPMYNGDLEADRPAVVNRFTGEIASSDALLFVTPEHNRSITAVLKNAIDWGSKPVGRNVWKGKVSVITGTTPGAIGTAVGQQHLRQILGILGSLVIGGEAYITFKPELINNAGEIGIETSHAFLESYLGTFLETATKLASA